MTDHDEERRREEGERYRPQREDLLLHQRVGELNGRMAAVEKDVTTLSNRLDGIEDQLNRMMRRMAWFAGGLAVILPVGNFVLWYMAIAGIGPFETAKARQEPSPAAVESAPLDPTNADKKKPDEGGAG